MIVGYVVLALLACIDALVSLFPSWTFTQPDNDGTIAVVSQVNGIFPVHDTALALLAALGLLLLLAAFDAGMWVYHQFWGSD